MSSCFLTFQPAFFPGTKFGILPTKERKKKASATHTKALLGGGRKNGPKSPDYEDQKFEIAICKTFGLVGFCMSPKIPYTLVGN